MPDTASPLTLVGAQQTGAPNPAQSPMSALQTMALDRMGKGQTYLDQQQEAYNRDMAQYAQMVEQSRLPENNEAAKWGAMAGAASSVEPTWGNIGSILGKTGQAYGGFQEQQQQQGLKNQGDLTKMRQAEVRALESKDQMAQLLKGQLPKPPNWIQFKDDAGNLIIMDKSVGPSSQQIVPAANRKLYEEALKIGARIAKDHDEPDPEAFAVQYAKSVIEKAPGSKVAVTTEQPPTVPLGATGPVTAPKPAGGAATNLDDVTQEVAKEKQAYADSRTPEEATVHQQNLLQLSQYISGLPQAQQDEVNRNLQRYIANQNPGTLKGLESSLTRVGALPAQTQAVAAGNRETAVEAAKEHAKMGNEIAARSTNFQNMATMLDNVQEDLKGMQPGSPIEPGKLANFKSGTLAWMKAMGVPLTPEGEDAIASAIALGKTNIKLASADTKAISSRPAVFEFMNMLKANPGPELTADTIKKLTDQMRQTVRFGAQENQDFVNWHQDNPLAPTADFSNYQNLVRTQTPWWNKFSENYNTTRGRYPTYADLAADAKEQGMTFNQLVSKMHAAANRRK